MRAERAVARYQERTRDYIVQALAGDGAGNVEVSGRAGWIWIRLDGSSDDVAQALNRASIALVEGAAVNLRRVRRYAASYYEILGASNAMMYDTLTSGESGTDFVKAHASQHERRDAGSGGSDPVDVYARMVVTLRARAQDTPNMTLRVESGFNPLTGAYVAAQDSPTFIAPTGLAAARFDLLYLDDADAPQILQGVKVVGGTPVYPAIPAGSVPLAYVYLTNATTTLTESEIYDARMVPSARFDTRAPVIVREAIFTFSGALFVQNGAIRVYNKFGSTLTIQKVFVSVNTAPTGAAIVVDVNLNGTTIFTTQANRPQIADGTNTGESSSMDVASFADGDYLQADVDQIGSTVAGADLTVQVIYQ